jgi:zinc protease
MRKKVSGLIPLCVLCLLALPMVTLVSAQSQLPTLIYKERKLANGLTLISAIDRSSPTVAVDVWYQVGSKDDPQGRSGFAHLFEHMMFKSTKNMPAEKMDRLTEDVGGFNNASTHDDYTNYYEVVPSNYLETLLWAEAERMANLNVDETNFKSERDVVKEEFRQSILAQPYGRLFYLIDKLSFAVHPYKRPGIGSIEELDASSLEDVRNFFKTFYRPDNARLIVVGDFNQVQLDAWVDRYFGRLTKPSLPIPRVTVTEPDRAEDHRFTEYSASAPLPAVAITYLAPQVSSADATVLQVAETILSGGDSSRLYQSLVYDQQAAVNAFGNADLRGDKGLFVLGAILAGGKKPEDVEKSLLAELAKMQAAEVKPDELSKAKNQLVTNRLQEFETNLGKAEVLGDASLQLGETARANSQLEQLRNVSAADIQRVMKKYFNDHNRVVIYYLPEAMRAGTSGGKSQ